jgi:ribosomal protein L24
VGLEEEAVFFLLQRATDEHQIRSAFTRGSIRGSIYVECILDAGMISLLNLTPGIIRKQSGVVRQIINPSDWVKLLTMQDPMTVVNAGRWVCVHNGVYKGELGFVTYVDEDWGAHVLVVPRLKIPTPQGATSLKRKRTAIKPEPALFDPATFSSVFQRQPKLQDDGTYTSRRLIFDHGLLRLNLDLHSISLVEANSAGFPSRILGLFNLSLHPALDGSKFPRPEEWVFEEGEKIIITPSEKEATVVAVKFTHLEVDLATKEGIKDVSWYNVRKVFSTGDFVSVTSGPLRGMMGWVERIEADTVYLLEYKEKGNVSTSSNDINVSFILIPADIY